MTSKIPEKHPLRQLFHALTDKASEDIGLVADLGTDKHVIGTNISNGMKLYIANLLTDFADFEAIRKIKDAQGKGVTTIRDLIYESEVALQTGDFDREGEIHKHIGDFTLFFAGVFPEFLQYLQTKSALHHPDYLFKHIVAGKSSYTAAAQHYRIKEDATKAFLCSDLSREFEINVLCINLVRNKLDQMQNPDYIKTRDLLLLN